MKVHPVMFMKTKNGSFRVSRADAAPILPGAGRLTQRDVRDEGTFGDVYENTGLHDKVSCEKRGFIARKSIDSRAVASY